MSLKELNLKYKYRSDSNQLVEEFYIKCLKESVRYDRAVGYFSSSSLPLLAKGLEMFISKKGKIRIICNPMLSEKDVIAIQSGIKSKNDLIVARIMQQIELSAQDIINDPLNTLAWLISMELLEIKIAYTCDNSIYHEKFGIFYDSDGNKIAFSGSANETYRGLIGNFEKVDVYSKENEIERIEDAIKDFEMLWSNCTKGLEVIEFPTVLLKAILKEKKKSPLSVNNPVVEKKFEIREYQQNAIDAFAKNNWSGIFNMATGTGKTITSLLAVEKFYAEKEHVFLVILVPYKHLVDQWEETLCKIGITKPIRCFDLKTKWIDKLSEAITDYNIGLVSKECVIAVYDTASKPEFQESIVRIIGNAFLIADECHNFGATRMKNHKFSNFSGKLGLSATPERWWDEIGSNRIKDFFLKTVYEYNIDEAIKDEKLVQYEYLPIISKLTNDEIEVYERISAKIVKLSFVKTKENDERIKRLALERSLVISKATGKHIQLINIFKAKEINEIKHTLVYCAPGEVDIVTLSLHKIGLQVHRFDSRVNNKRRGELLKLFAEGVIQVLVAIRCLDEGVDVPSTKEAYFLASTSNPREFIQRRGRVLRPSLNKNIAKIYDFIVLPDNVDDATFLNIASKEMPRFAEFSRYAINKYVARNVVHSILTAHELEHLMDKLPWEVYFELKDKYGGENEN